MFVCFPLDLSKFCRSNISVTGRGERRAFYNVFHHHIVCCYRDSCFYWWCLIHSPPGARASTATFMRLWAQQPTAGSALGKVVGSVIETALLPVHGPPRLTLQSPEHGLIALLHGRSTKEFCKGRLVVGRGGRRP